MPITVSTIDVVGGRSDFKVGVTKNRTDMLDSQSVANIKRTAMLDFKLGANIHISCVCVARYTCVLLCVLHVSVANTYD